LRLPSSRTVGLTETGDMTMLNRSKGLINMLREYLTSRNCSVRLVNVEIEGIFSEKVMSYWVVSPDISDTTFDTILVF